MSATIEIDGVVPRSVRNLWHAAQISHLRMPPPAALLDALRSSKAADDENVALAFQEASIEEVARLMVDEVLTGTEILGIVARQAAAGRLRRPDLLDWSGMFA